jgi:cytosine/adenosine deaminase-related metal-dependent hydrolase/ubiquinone/menaquinone biosynthesis C-methylase UbiE
MSSASQATSDRSERELRNTKAFGVLAKSYDTQVNPLLALEERYLRHMLPKIAGLDVLDAGCGSGRWLGNLAKLQPRSLTGIDASAEMLQVARQKKIPATQLIQSACEEMPVPEQSFDLIISSFVMSHIEDFARVVSEVDRVARDGCDLFLSDMHPETQRQLGWKRAFQHKTDNIVLESFSHDLRQIITVFENRGWKVCAAIEPGFGNPERQLFEFAGRLESFLQAEQYPAIYLLHLRKQESTLPDSPCGSDSLLCRARLALGPAETVDATLRIAGDDVSQILSDRLRSRDSDVHEIDLTGYMVMPGLINAHDHLEFALFPRLANPPYVNASAWAIDIQERFKDLIARHRSVPKEVRLWWGGIRNLLCGVTTVCHHNTHEAELYREDFPVRVLQNFGWSHSLTFGGDLRANRAATPAGYPFVIHACEGTDTAATEELWELDRIGILDKDSVLVHALALDDEGLSLLRRRGASVIICPSSNDYLFGRVPDIPRLERVGRTALGNDSPLTALGDLLDEIRFAIGLCDVSPKSAYDMVTKEPAEIFRLRNAAGSIKVSGAADLIAIRGTDGDAADRLHSLSAKEVELVVVGGRVQLSSPSMLGRIPKSMSSGLEPLWVDGTVRWLRAPVGRLLRQAEEVLGTDAVRLGGKPIRSPRQEELSYAG